jgi:Condensation domain
VSVDAPLSYGQLYSWREIETYPQDWLREANLSTIWSLRGISPDRVSAALRRLVDRHESLRTTYHLRAGDPLQRVHPAAAPPIEHVNRTITGHDDWKRAADELAQLAGAPFPMTGDVGWRGVLGSSGGAPMLLALSFSHLILDIWSVQNLEAQFQELVADLNATAPPAPTPRELAHQQPRPYDGGERYWRRVLHNDPMHQLPSLAAGAKQHRIQATLHSPRLAWLAEQAAKRLGVTTPAVLMALVAAGLSRHLDLDRVTISLMASNRFTPQLRHVVGTMNQLIPVAATVDHGSSLAEHITRQHWAAARAYRHSCYDFDQVATLAADVATHNSGDAPTHGCWFNHLFRCWFNYIQFDNQPPDPAAHTPAELIWTPLARQYGQPIDIRVTARRGSTSVALRADPTIIPAEALTDILRAVALGVQLAASEPHSSLKEIWSGTLTPSLFPHELPPPPN